MTGHSVDFLNASVSTACRTFEAADVVHKIVDVMYCLTVAGAALFIHPRSEMKDLENGNALGLATCLTVNALILGFEKLEVMFKDSKTLGPRGSPARLQSLRNLIWQVCPRVASYMAAAYAAFIYYSKADVSNVQSWLDYDMIEIFLFCSFLFGTLVQTAAYLLKFLPPNPIPWHYQHIAHRYGKWLNGSICSNIPKTTDFFLRFSVFR